MVALSLRHRIPETAANTFEGYFHPRVLAFALGLVGIGLFLHAARRSALAVAAFAVAVHPTTGGWFLVWLGAAAWVMASVRTRWIAGIAGVVIVLGVAAVARDELAARLTIMDPAWISAFSGRDYVFPTASWSVGAWLALLVGPVIVLAVSIWRRRIGEQLAARARHRVRCAVALWHLSSLTALHRRTRRAGRPVADLARLLADRVSGDGLHRVGIAEAPWTARPADTRARVVLAILLVAAAARGFYILRIEHHNPLVAVWPQETDWRRLGRWIAATTPRDAHFLLHPEHVYRYGSSFRVVAQRDVLLEVVKDRAMAMYSREAAIRLEERLQAAGDVAVIDEGRIAVLANRYDLDYLVTERELDLRLVHQEGVLRLYRLE